MMRLWLRVSAAIGAIAMPAFVFFAHSSAVFTAKAITAPTQAPVGVFAPFGEATFEQAYKVKLNLPMREVDFLTLVEKLGLKYGGQGPDSEVVKHREYGYLFVDRPRLITNYDLSNISHSYRVYRSFNWWRLRTEIYLALVNKQRMVVYVESQFDYVQIGP